MRTSHISTEGHYSLIISPEIHKECLRLYRKRLIPKDFDKDSDEIVQPTDYISEAIENCKNKLDGVSLEQKSFEKLIDFL
ncbi:MAG: hypothetical protein ABFQ65_00165 [Nanoarchaeota archaeon]